MGAPGTVGADLVGLMEAQRHRGADSTGFALYGEALEQGYIVRAMASRRDRLSDDLQDFLDILREFGSDFMADPSHDDASSEHVSLRLTITDPSDFAAWSRQADEICERIEIQSVGRSLEIIKDLGGAKEVADKHGIRDFIGTHGLGHARLATESSVSPTASHPFWARPFPDIAIVHNGQITDYYTWRDKLEQAGYRFMTYNDSELIAVWISDQMSKGLTQAEALERSISEIDGVFTYLISNTESMGFAKDRWAIKPLVAVEEAGEMAVATEEQAVRTVYPGDHVVDNYDGPSMTNTWPIAALKEAA
ncbi:MAG TPA: glutamine amidotransferase [Alphaproteobacteria bacterium]|nr:class II glutamine amidotransferase [Alphaproteobacteria bacterium]MDP7429738.1 class II glutamine amidotransferase [Alphaproteobacteria bacterium]HJM52267.1 glutamine amidotransferase [Alphaproteobacteria bacterium]